MTKTTLLAALLAPALLGIACPRPATRCPRKAASIHSRLIAELASSSWQKRAQAARALGAMRAPAAIQPLIKACADSDARVREAVVWALGIFPDPAFVPVLKTALVDRVRAVRLQAVKALGQHSTRAAARALVMALGSRVGRDRVIIVEALAQMRGQALQGLAAVVPLLITELSATPVPRQQAAARALAAIGAPAVFPLLKAMLDSGPDAQDTDIDLECRFHACRTLVSMGARAIPAMMKILSARQVAEDDEDDDGNDDRLDVQERVKIVLSRMGAAPVPFLIPFLGKQNDLDDLAVEVLQDLGAKAVPGIVRALKTGSVTQRLSMVELLGGMHGESSNQALVKALRDPSVEVQKLAALLLATRTDPKARAVLLEVLKRGKEAVRLAVLNGLAGSMTHRSLRFLVSLLRSPNEKLAAAAARAMGRTGSKHAVPALLKALASKRESVRRAAIRSLGQLQNPQAYKPLAAIARKGSDTQRLTAIAALGDLGSKPAKKLLVLLAKSRDKPVAAAARQALQVSRGLIGVPACDEYLKVYRCYIGRLPAAAQAPTRAAYKKMVAVWRKSLQGAGKGGVTRATIAKSCRMVLGGWKKAMRKNPLAKGCF